MPLRRQLDPGADAVQQPKPQFALKQPQLVADRAARQVQLVRRLPDSAVAGKTFQRPQRLRSSERASSVLRHDPRSLPGVRVLSSG